MGAVTAPSGVGAAPGVWLRVPFLLRGRFICTGARILDSSAHKAEVTAGHMERPHPWYGFRPFQRFWEGGAHRPLRHPNE
ncbi:hypothetical protein GCM10018791_53120 [Streptomyces zaomyceticus]|nr:hypothetical protein GCM10018791_53120 [Streptomyces zaomyceticus]